MQKLEADFRRLSIFARLRKADRKKFAGPNSKAFLWMSERKTLTSN